MPLADLRYDPPHEDRITVATQWNEKDMIKSVFGALWDASEKIWTVPATWTACLQLRGTFGEALEVSDSLMNWAWLQRGANEALMAQRERLAPETALDQYARTPLPGLYPFQQVGAAFIQGARGALLCDEMGTGKTIQVLAALHEIATACAPEPLHALVICPASVKRNWVNEAARWLPTWGITLVEGTAAERRRALAHLQQPQPGPQLVVVNYELTRTMSRLAPYGSERLRRCRVCDPLHGEDGVTPARCQVHPKELNQIRWDVVVVDEAHRVKDPHSQQTRAAWRLAEQPEVQHRWALTGTPMANHPGDLWSLLRLVAPDEFPTKTVYVDRYCLSAYNPFGGLDIVGLRPERADEFHAVVGPHMRRVLKAQVLTQLPPKVRETRWVDMTPRQRRAYDQLEDQLAAVLYDEDGQRTGVIQAATPLVARLRQMQFASATCAVDVGDTPSDPRTWRVSMTEPSSKLDELEAVLDELGDKPVAICAYHRQLVELAAARLAKRGGSCGLITGAVDEVTRSIVLQDFQAGRLRYLLFTISAGGVGLTMTAADTLIFLQRSWSMVEDRQAEDRVHRIGSEVHAAVTIIDLVTRDSVEENQVAAIHDKLRRLDEVTQDRLRLVPGPDGRVNADAARELDEYEAILMQSVEG